MEPQNQPVYAMPPVVSPALATARALKKRIFALFGCVLGFHAAGTLFVLLFVTLAQLLALVSPPVADFIKTDAFIWLIQLLCYLPTLLLPFEIYRATQHFSRRVIFRKQKVAPVFFGLAALPGMALAFSISYLAQFLSQTLSALTGLKLEQSSAMPGSAAGIVLFVLATAVLPPLVEEYIFRGIILRTLIPFGKAFAIVVSAGVFAMMHGSIPQMLATFCLGLVLGFLAVKTGSIWPSVLLHFLNNSVACAEMFLYDRCGQQLYSLVAYPAEIAVVLAGFLFLFFWGRKHEETFRLPEKQQELSARARKKIVLTNPLFILCLCVAALLIVSMAVISALTAYENDLVSSLQNTSALLGGWFI